jgi:hypothetical protein
MNEPNTILAGFTPQKAVTKRVYDDVSRQIDDILLKAEAVRVKNAPPTHVVKQCVCGVELDLYMYPIHRGFVISSTASHYVKFHRGEIPEGFMITLRDCVESMSSSTRERLCKDDPHGRNHGLTKYSKILGIGYYNQPDEVTIRIKCGHCEETCIREFKHKGAEEIYLDFGKGEYGRRTSIEVEDGKTCNWCWRNL